jgi:hypothetical protein
MTLIRRTQELPFPDFVVPSTRVSWVQEISDLRLSQSGLLSMVLEHGAPTNPVLISIRSLFLMARELRFQNYDLGSDLQ